MFSSRNKDSPVFFFFFFSFIVNKHCLFVSIRGSFALQLLARMTQGVQTLLLGMQNLSALGGAPVPFTSGQFFSGGSLV